MDSTEQKRGRPKRCDSHEYVTLQLRIPKKLIEEIDAVILLAQDKMFGLKDNRHRFMLRGLIHACAEQRKAFAAQDKIRKG